MSIDKNEAELKTIWEHIPSRYWDYIPYQLRGTSKFQLEYNIDEKVIPRLKKIAEDNPSSSTVHFILGMLLNSKEYFDKAIEINSEFCDAYYLRGKWNSEKYNDEEAYDDFNNAIKFIDKRKYISLLEIPYIYYQLGILESELGTPIKAIDYFTTAISFSLDQSFYFGRISIYLKLKDIPNALKDVEKILEFEPDNFQAFYIRAELRKILYRSSKSDKGFQIPNAMDFGKDRPFEDFFTFISKLSSADVDRMLSLNVIDIPKDVNWKDKNKRYCPACGSNKISFYSYGVPDWDDMTNKDHKDLNNGEEILAGCAITNDSPAYICRDCRTQIGKAIDGFNKSFDNYGEEIF